VEDLLQHNIRGPKISNDQVLELITPKKKVFKIAVRLLGHMSIANFLKVSQFIKIC
jgi:hypothetical protein